MNRRKLLLGSGVALSTMIAGCSSDDTGGGNGGSGNGNGESSNEAQFELESLDMPDEVEIGEEWSWSMTIANTGSAAGTFETTVNAKTTDTDFSEIGNIELDIAAGETATYESDTGIINYLTRATYRFEALDTEQEVQAVTRSMTFGESYETPLYIATSAHGIDLRDTYSYEGWDGSTETEEASSGMQWAFLEFEATNEAGSTEWVPLKDNINLIAGSSQYDYAFINKEKDRYDGGEVQAGITRRGWIAYEIPEDLSVADLEVAYSDSNYDGEWSVRWRSA